MYTNRYVGVIEDWKVELITQRARRFGFRGMDLEDAQQEIALQLARFEYSPEKSNGATEATAVTAIVDRRLAMIRRREMRHNRRIERLAQDECSQTEDLSATEAVHDVRRAIAGLPRFTQQVCEALGDGMSVNEVACHLGVSWHTVRQQIELIRRHFQRLGLDPSSVSKEAAAA